MGFIPPVLKKYVDDLVLALPANKVDDVLGFFNNFHPSIQFTCELENDRRLPFLDMVLVRQSNQTIKTEWYCKPMASGRFLDFVSNHPLHMKINMATNFIRRVRELSSNLTSEVIDKTIFQNLKINHYPISLVNRLLNHKPTSQPEKTTTNPNQYAYRSLPFVNNLSSRIKKAMKAEYPCVILADKNVRSVGDLFTNTKDPIKPDMKNNVVYCIPCAEEGCNSNYVGYTTRHLKKRISNHRTSMNQFDDLLRKAVNPAEKEKKMKKMREESTALIHHCMDTEHRFDLAKTTILDQHRRKTALPVLEVCHIVTTERTVNKRNDINFLSSAYAGILNTVKENKNKINKKYPPQQATTQNISQQNNFQTEER